jgi:hypothetical protein
MRCSRIASRHSLANTKVAWSHKLDKHSNVKYVKTGGLEKPHALKHCKDERCTGGQDRKLVVHRDVSAGRALLAKTKAAVAAAMIGVDVYSLLPVLLRPPPRPQPT